MEFWSTAFGDSEPILLLTGGGGHIVRFLMGSSVDSKEITQRVVRDLRGWNILGCYVDIRVNKRAETLGVVVSIATIFVLMTFVELQRKTSAKRRTCFSKDLFDFPLSLDFWRILGIDCLFWLFQQRQNISCSCELGCRQLVRPTFSRLVLGGPLHRPKRLI